jgi:DnaK suppressor protein
VAAVAAGGPVGYNTRPLGLKKQQDLTVAAKSKVAPKKVAKASKPAAKSRATTKPAAKPVAKSAAKPAAKPVAKKGAVKTLATALAKLVKPAKPAAKKPAAAPKPAAKPTPKALKAVAKPAPKPAAKPTPKPAAKPLGKAVEKATEKPVAAKPAAKPHNAPAATASGAASVAKPPAAKPAVGKAGGKESSQNARTAMPAATPERATARPSDNGLKARAVKPNKPVNPNEAPPLALPAAKVDLPEGYRPASGEEYMNPLHLEYFRRKLIAWRAELVEESKQTIDNLREEVRDVGDEAERATRETENSLELRTRDRYRKLIGKIDKALKRIDDGAYGYCEETGEEIGIERLEARPIATLCLDAQERWEHRQKLMGD